MKEGSIILGQAQLCGAGRDVIMRATLRGSNFYNDVHLCDPNGFNVKIQSGVDCWSGCSGIGLERWTAAFLAQKGLDCDKWPEAVAKLVGEPKELFKFL